MTETIELTRGTTAVGYEPVREHFAQLLAAEPGYSAGVAAYVDGECVADLQGGELTAESLVPVYSATKGAAGICIALLVERGELDLDAPMSHYWPEFGAAGKSEVAVRTVLSHQAGMIGLDGGYHIDELLAHEPVARRLAAQRPFWRPGAGHGYHAITIGVLADELVRRIAGCPLSELYDEAIRIPRDIELFVAIPDSEQGRVVTALPPEITEDNIAAMEEFEALLGPGSFADTAMNSEGEGFGALPTDLVNLPAARRAGVPAASGTGTARGLAKLYACCISDVAGPRLLSPETVATVAQTQTVGEDLVLRSRNRFAIVFQNPDDRLAYGSHRTFGHDGAGGAIGYADPRDGLCFGYVTPRMPFPGGADVRGLGLAATIRTCMAAR